ncbi:zinc knuckle CX2CX4HX4C containing protein [Tanacetum coccineum]
MAGGFCCSSVSLLILVLLMERKGVLFDGEELLQGDSRGETIIGDDSRLTQSPLVSPTAPLPLQKSNVDVATTFGVSLSTVGDLKVLRTDIDAGKYWELLSGMTNDKHKLDFDALGALCDFIKVESASRPGFDSDGSRNESSVLVTMHTSSPVEEVLIHSIDDVAALFGVPLNSLKDIDEFTKDLKVAAGASAKNQPKVNYNFHHLIADPVFDGVNISIPRKVVKRAGLEAVLEGGPWLILFEEDGISLIATFIGKPVMLDSYTSSICNDSWGRSSFTRRLIEVNSKADFVDVVTIGIPSLTGDGFTKETIRVEYEWRPPRCDICKIFSHVHDHCPKKVKKRKGKSKSNNGGQFASPSVKQTVRYEPKVTTSAPKKGTTNVGNASTSSSMLKTTGTSSKKDNISTSNSFSALNDDEENEDESVKNVYDESGNLFPNTKTGGNTSFTAAAG